MDILPYRYEYSLEVFNVFAKYKTLYLYSATAMEYSSSLDNKQEVIIELYLSETET